MKKVFSEYSNPVNSWIFALVPIPFSLYYPLHYGDVWQTDYFLFGMFFIVTISETLLLGYIWTIFCLKLRIDEKGVSFRYLSWRFQPVHYDWYQIKSTPSWSLIEKRILADGRYATVGNMVRVILPRAKKDCSWN